MDVVLPPEFAGMAALNAGVLDVGGVTVRLPVRWQRVPVYVRRCTNDLAIVEVAIAVDDSLAQEELDAENAEADRYPLGPKEYWRSKMVGKDRHGPDEHLMTEDDFEEFWDEDR